MRSTVARHLRASALIGQRDPFVRTRPRPDVPAHPAREGHGPTGQRVTGSPGTTAPQGTTAQLMLLEKREHEVVCGRCRLYHPGDC